MVGDDARIGVAVSGGPDSLALLLLAHAVGRDIEAATVDHQLRAGSAQEAADVAGVCARIDVPHFTLPVGVSPGASVQAKARIARYEALERWAKERDRDVILTAHHLDDQAETLLMRLARGAGLGGLAAIRASLALPNGLIVARPLLGWRKSYLETLVRDAGLSAVDDPSNRDPAHDRTRIRAILAADDFLDPPRLAATSRHLARSEEALAWTTAMLAGERIEIDGDGLMLDVGDLPQDLQRRLTIAAMGRLGVMAPRGRDLDSLLVKLADGRLATLGGLKFSPGARWRVAPAPPRTA